MNISDAIAFGGDALRQASIAEPEREVNLLLRHSLKRDATFIYSHPEYRLDAVESILFKAVLKRRAGREPFQYITGVQEFYGLEFEVTGDVLIPRPETEILVEAAIGALRDAEAPRFCEIGVGSGCISVSILRNVSNAAAIAVDVSEAAVKVAAKNAAKHSVNDRLLLARSNVFENVSEIGFDAVVSNPPYVPDGDILGLQEEVRSFEPRSALVGGLDGLDIVKQIIDDAPNHLKAGGLLLMEIGWDQSAQVADMLDPDAWKDVAFLPDLQGIPRIVKANIR
jgi:release factor glutamine methyltransferase